MWNHPSFQGLILNDIWVFPEQSYEGDCAKSRPFSQGLSVILMTGNLKLVSLWAKPKFLAFLSSTTPDCIDFNTQHVRFGNWRIWPADHFISLDLTQRYILPLFCLWLKEGYY